MPRVRFVFAFLTSLVAAAAVVSGEQQNAQVALRIAIEAETVRGDLQSAIAQYEAVIKTFGRSDRAIAAQALMRLADVYRTMGDNQSRNAYQRLVNEYPEQRDLFIQATARLRALDSGLSVARGGHQLIFNTADQDDVWDFTPDGRSVVVTNWADSQTSARGGDLDLVNTMTGARTRLVEGGCGMNVTRCVMTESAVFSPDQRDIAFTMYDDSNNRAGHLRIIESRTGASPRTLHANPEYGVWPLAWAPDGRRILVQVRSTSDRSSKLGWVSFPDGRLQVLKSLGWRYSGGAVVSPDGKFVAFPALVRDPGPPPLSADDPRDTHIHVMSADGQGTETTVVRGAGINSGPVWTPDGRHLLFVSDRSGTVDLWAQRIDSGRAVGGLTLIRPEVGRIDPIRFTNSGALIYGRGGGAAVQQTAIIEMEAQGARTRQVPPVITSSIVGSGATWSGDGSQLAVLRAGTSSIAVHTIATGEERTYAFPGLQLAPVRWLKQETGFLVTIRDAQGVDALHRVDPVTGRSTLVMSFGPRPRTGNVGQLGPDDRTLYVMGRAANAASGNNDRIVAYDIATGTARDTLVLPMPGRLSGFAVSRDGNRLAVIVDDAAARTGRLVTSLTDGSEVRELYKASTSEISAGQVRFTADSQHVLFRLQDAGIARARMMRVSVNGGVPEPTGLEMMFWGPPQNGLPYFALSRDGSKLAYSVVDRAPYEFWSLDIPLVKAAAR